MAEDRAAADSDRREGQDDARPDGGGQRGTGAAIDSTTLRRRQEPLKARYQTDPASARLTFTVGSAPAGDDPMRSRVVSVPATGAPAPWEVAAHPMAGGDGDLPCSGDVLLASLAACQEITLRMVATAMGIAMRSVEVVVEGDLDFRGTIGVDPETPVGFQRIRTEIAIDADAPADRLDRLMQRAERYCVVAATLRESPEITVRFRLANATAQSDRTVDA